MTSTVWEGWFVIKLLSSLMLHVILHTQHIFKEFFHDTYTLHFQGILLIKFYFSSNTTNWFYMLNPQQGKKKKKKLLRFCL